MSGRAASHRHGVVALALVCAALTGCAGGGGGALAPLGAVHRPLPPVHVVQSGETLYYIAWLYGESYRDVAARNGISPPYRIVPGERIVMRAPAGTTPREASPRRPPVAEAPPPPVRSAPVTAPPVAHARARPAPPPERPAPREEAVPRKPRAHVAPTAVSSKRFDSTMPVARWVWPARGPLIGSFRAGGGNGVDIGGHRGQPVYAAAAGEVVYDGSGLIGYGRLIIIKHNARYLSAYAHNDTVVVHEGETVRAGQQIATMGSSGAARVNLHFEIRKDGRPVNPLNYLPR